MDTYVRQEKMGYGTIQVQIKDGYIRKSKSFTVHNTNLNELFYLFIRTVENFSRDKDMWIGGKNGEERIRQN